MVRIACPLICLLCLFPAIFHTIGLLLLQSQDLIQWPLSFIGTGVSEGPPDAIPQCKELAIVVVVEEVVVGVMSAAIDIRLQESWDAVVGVVYGHSPDVDEDEEAQVCDLQVNRVVIIIIIRMLLLFFICCFSMAACGQSHENKNK